jgi:hypothetical protein
MSQFSCSGKHHGAQGERKAARYAEAFTKAREFIAGIRRLEDQFIASAFNAEEAVH